MLTGLSYLELIPMFPQSAAEYVYVRNSVRNKLVPFIIRWTVLIAGVVSAMDFCYDPDMLKNERFLGSLQNLKHSFPASFLEDQKCYGEG
jgi:hypothetical protein